MRTAGWLWQRGTPTTSEPLLRSLTRSMHRAVHQDVLAPVD
jgi:hypothetical protein